MAGCDVTPQTDEIKPFVLCRESCDMVVGSIRHLHWSEDTPKQLEAITSEMILHGKGEMLATIL